MSEEKCPHPYCQHHAAGYHHVMCPLDTMDMKVNIISQLLREVERWKAYGQRRTATIAIYQGKCAVLRHENNKLRKKMEKHRDELPPGD